MPAPFARLAWFGLLLPGLAYTAPPELDQLLATGHYQAAYQLAQKLLAEQEGLAEFDWSYAQAAMHSGHYREALFAFERLRITEPDNPRLQLEIARAYFALGDDDNASAEFEAVLAQSPPAAVKANIEQYLQQIRQRQKARQPGWSVSLGGLVGHDSNINSATQQQYVDFGPISQIELSANSRQIDDEFNEWQTNLQYQHPLNKVFSGLAGLSYQERNNWSSNDFDSRTINLNLGGQWQVWQGQLRAQWLWSRMQLDDQGFMRQPSLGLDYFHPLSPQQGLQAFWQLGKRYYDQNPQRQVNLGIGGLGWVGRIEGWQLSSSYYFGDEDSPDGRYAQFGRNYQGIRLGAQYPHDKHLFSVQLGYQTSRQDAADKLSQNIRREYLRQLSLSDRYQWTENWTLEPRYQYLDNATSADLYRYRRHQFSLGLGYQF